MEQAIIPVNELVKRSDGLNKVLFFLIVLDQSDSMDEHREAVLEMLNSVVKDMRGTPGAELGRLAIITFADYPAVYLPATSLLEVQPMTVYRPKGNTALYAAVKLGLGAALAFRQALSERPDPPEFICNVAVISDGGDNRSPDDKPLLHDMSRQARECGFTLSAFGIGIDHVKLSRNLGFDPSTGVTVPATQEGIRQASRRTSETFTGTIVFSTKGGGFTSKPPKT